MTRRGQILALFGPTGVGKTDVAVHLAAKCDTIVINADPAQCYAGLPILTNKPGPEHDAIAEHRMVGVWPLTHASTIVHFAGQVHAAIDEALEAFGTVVVCGGSGLYLQAALTKLAVSGASSVPAHNPELRAKVEEWCQSVGPYAAHERLAQEDPASAARIHPHDLRRIIRALELVQLGGQLTPPASSMWDAPPRRPYQAFGVTMDRPVIRLRIEQRTRSMFDGGLLDEVSAEVGPHCEYLQERFSETARRLHGLSDCIEALQGVRTVDEAIRQMTTRTQQYAKRQGTWARRMPGLKQLSIDGRDAAQVATVIAGTRTG